MKRFTWVVLAMLLAAPALAQNVTFQWDPHPEAAGLAEFRLYQTKTCGTYGAFPVAVFTGGSTVTGTITSPGLGRYCFVLTAVALPEFDSLESNYSNEVTLVVKPKPPRLVSAVQTALAAPIKGAKKLFEWAGLIEHKNLRVK